MDSKQSSIDNYEIIKTLGSGYSGDVKLVEEKTTKNKYAIKFVKLLKNDMKTKRIVELLKKECQIMHKLNHKNIIKLIKGKKGVYNSKSNQKINVVYAVLELAPNGEIFELLYNTGKFNENVTRYYALQICDIIEYLHSQNIAHRDLKPENLLLGENLDLKLVDFGFSTIIKDEKNKTMIGTPTYMAPEILYAKPYDAKKVDIFALGVILFTFYFGTPPFNNATLDDVYYKSFLYNTKEFWKFHIKNSKRVEWSKKFVVMISRMLCFDFKDRFSIEEVINCDWMKEQVDCLKAKNDIRIYFNCLKKVIKKSEMEIEYDMETKSSGNFLERDDNIIFNLILDENYRPNIILGMKNEEKVVDKILDAFYCIKDDYKGSIVWNEKKSKFSFRFVTSNNDVIIIKVKLYKIGTEFGVNFMRKEGRAFDYYEIKNKIIDCLQE